jgi:hypothetical protein
LPTRQRSRTPCDALRLADQLELTLELLRQDEWPGFAEAEPLPGNVIRFRPRARR